MANGRDKDSSRAKKTLYVTGFDARRTTKELLEELFMQGGPVSEVKLFDTHAYVQFQDQDSIPYCLALFSEIELHGRKLRINAKTKSRESLSHLKYLMQVREILREQYTKMPPPNLPPKKMPPQKQSPSTRRRRAREGDRDDNRSNAYRSAEGRRDSKSKRRRAHRDQTIGDNVKKATTPKSGRRRK